MTLKPSDYEVTRSTKRNIHEFHQTGFSQKLGPVKISKMFLFLHMSTKGPNGCQMVHILRSGYFSTLESAEKNRKFHHSERS